MNDMNLDGELRETAYRIVDLSQRVAIDPQQKALLKHQLIQRHHDLALSRSRRATPRTWPGLHRLRRFALIAPPALAAAVACSVLLWALQVSGHQKTQTVEAARITRALARSAPTVTAWRWTVRTTKQHEGPVLKRFSSRLDDFQRLYIRYNRPYLYSHGHWSRVTWDSAGLTERPEEWKLAFAVLPALLDTDHRSIFDAPAFHGHNTQGVRTVLGRLGSDTVTVTALIDRKSGLVLEMERVLQHAKTTVERDVVDYEYSKSTT